MYVKLEIWFRREDWHFSTICKEVIAKAVMDFWRKGEVAIMVVHGLDSDTKVPQDFAINSKDVLCIQITRPKE